MRRTYIEVQHLTVGVLKGACFQQEHFLLLVLKQEKGTEQAARTCLETEAVLAGLDCDAVYLSK